MRLDRRNYFLYLLISICILFLTACGGSIVTLNTSTDPQPIAAYILVTAVPQITPTPFQPSVPTPLPQPSETPSQTAEPQPTDTLTPESSPTVAELPTSVPSDTSQPTSQPSTVDKPQYVISALMDYAGHTVTVSETVIYPNRSQDALPSIALAVNSD